MWNSRFTRFYKVTHMCYMDVVYEKCLERKYQTNGGVIYQPLLVSEN